MSHQRYPDDFDVIVIGGGHAGTEAALAAARMGANTLLVTQSIEALGQMSCNPAIGGIGKSHLVREVDALDGIMARAADEAGIQFRTLNASKGPAVRAVRAQADRDRYRRAVRRYVERQENLHLFQQSVVDLLMAGDRVRGVVTQMGLEFAASAVVLTTGTFLGGRIHIGMANHEGGRAGDAPANALAARLRALPFRVDRLKTGTPPRIAAASVDFTRLTEQPGDEPRPVMSFLGRPEDHPPQVSCYIAHTNERTHDIIRAGLDRSPLYGGVIDGVGPRYCPSIEDKVVRFHERDTHQIFVEPEGLDCDELYPNGISTSLPFDVQLALVRSIEGFERAHITRPGYAIEYDFFDPRDLHDNLETHALEGLFFAGQINGTTGYEEAASQGLLAGANAALKVAGRPAWTPRRDEAYLGVLVDDLINLGTNEPYRMFTSRAEYRLRLRQDNADVRLTERGRELSLVGDERWQAYRDKRQGIAEWQQRLRQTRVLAGSPLALQVAAATGDSVTRGTDLLSLLKRPRFGVAELATLRCLPDALSHADVQALEQLAVETRYAGYVERQDREIERVRRHESIALPAGLDYGAIEGLSNELTEKLSHARPATLARASRIPGMTPAALSLLLVHAKKLQGAKPVGDEALPAGRRDRA